MSSNNEGPGLLDDPLEVLSNDEDAIDPIQETMGVSLSNINSDTPLSVNDVDEDNIKPHYPEDAVEDEGQLVDEHDDGGHDALDFATPDERAMINATSQKQVTNSKAPPSSPKNRRKRDVTTMRKAPQAPKRFKSSYICFFTSKQTEIKNILGDKATVMDISKRSAQMWKELGPEERSLWEDVAAKDKERYMLEKSTYNGPWQVPYKRAKKDPSAPKRPMSAFLLFSQGRRGKIKEIYPGIQNTEVSRLLGEQWRNSTEKERLPFIEEEKALRENYKKALSRWKDKEGERKEEEMRLHNEQLEWQKRQHQIAIQKTEQYPRHGTIPPSMDSYSHPMYMIQPSPQTQGYSMYHHPQGYPHAPHYAPYPHQGYQYGAVGKQHPAILSPNGLPLYPPQVPPQHFQQQSQLLPSPTPPPHIYYQQAAPAPTQTSAFDLQLEHEPSLLPDSEYPDLVHLDRESHTAELT